MKPDPVRVALIFLGAASTSLVFGGAILFFAWQGFRRGSYPLTPSRHLTGVAAKFISIVVALFGLIVFGCGLATLYFGFLRMRQLL